MSELRAYDYNFMSRFETSQLDVSDSRPH